METPDLLTFTRAARMLGVLAREYGLASPAFRSPPHVPNVDFDVRRYEGGAVVAVRTKDRAIAAVLADMVTGFLEANDRPSHDPLGVILLARIEAA